MSIVRVLVVAGAFWAALASADEGLWQPSQLPDIAGQLQQAGLQMDVDSLVDPSGNPTGAVVQLGTCSGALVSPQGLILTNHHCVAVVLQKHATSDTDLPATGFAAADMAGELAGPDSLRVYITIDMSDVTDRVRQAANSLTGQARFQAIQRVTRSLVRDCEREPGIRCRVDRFYAGYRYQLSKRLEIRDVRLAYAPSRNIGQFGGDQDNWTWPRHSGDFAVLRAYVGPDGQPADPSPDNQPYRPTRFLKIASRGINEGEFAMVMGYPGRTQRYRLALELDGAIRWAYPTQIETIQEQLAIIRETLADDPQAQLRYRSQLARLSNSLKQVQGMLAGLSRDDLLERKRASEYQLRDWLQSDQTLSGEYLDELEQLEQELVLMRGTRDRDFYYREIRQSSQLLNAASLLYRWSMERQKPDTERASGFQDRDRFKIEARLRELQHQFDVRVDRALMAHGIGHYASLTASKRVNAFDRAMGLVGDDPDLSGVDVRLQAIYEATSLAGLQPRLAWLEQAPEAFSGSDDPIIQLAIALHASDRQLDAEKTAREGRLEALRSRYMEALLAYQAAQGGALYDDGNHSLRVSFGQVRGYSPRDGVNYSSRTTLAGIAEKHTGQWPYQATRRQLQLIANQDLGSYFDPSTGTLPVNFLTTADLASGSSGSPTLNGRGELVGLAFDGNLEGLGSDWAFNPELTRAIHVDIRYLLWVLDRVEGQAWLVQELITPR